MIRCVVCHNEEPVKTYELEESSITIGRLPENTISIANMGISRRHVRIDRDVGGEYILSDLGSLNGTYVNNKKVKKTALSQGDKITIGKYDIILEEIISENSLAQSSQPASYQGENNTPPKNSHGPSMEEENKFHPQPDHSKPPTPVFIDTSKHTVYPIKKRVISLGSCENDDIFIEGFGIGDAHLLVEKREDGLWLSAGKRTGKFKVNGKKTTSHKLKHKDRVEIGKSVFAYMENG